MAKYKVKVIGHLCKGNHVAKFGEIVDESQLTTPASGLINTGFIGDDYCWIFQSKEALSKGNVFLTLVEPSPYSYFRPLSSLLFTQPANR